SRRRHTSSDRDWSSDVCSSDLAKTPRQAVRRALSLLAKSGIRPAGLVLNRLRRSRGVGYSSYYASHGYGKEEGAYSRSYGRRSRSEERRVGRGSRARAAAEQTS